MKKIPFLFAVLFLLFSFNPVKKKKIIFFGDSITQAGVEPGGYISVADSLLNPKGGGGYDLVGAGIGGNKIYDLYLRMDSDVLAKSPDVVIIWVGVNDVWHKTLLGTGTDADKFERFYNAVIKKLKAANAKVILCTPATIGEKNDNSNQQDGDLNKYSGIIRRIAREQQTPLIDLRKAFADYEKDHNPNNVEKGVLTKDGVHLNVQGNAFVAGLMVEAIRKLQ